MGDRRTLLDPGRARVDAERLRDYATHVSVLSRIDEIVRGKKNPRSQLRYVSRTSRMHQSRNEVFG